MRGYGGNGTGIALGFSKKLLEEIFDAAFVECRYGTDEYAINWIIKEILATGFDITIPISVQKLNDHIKEICKIAEIDTPVQIARHAGGKRIIEVVPKWQLVSNHTARRSGLTNMVKAGVPISSVMKISTHTTVKSFFIYLKISLEENADILAESAF